MSLQTGQVSVDTTATLIATVGASVPDSDGVLISSSAAVFIGGSSSVTADTGFAVPENTPVLFPTTGAEPIELYGITSSSTAAVSYAYPG